MIDKEIKDVVEKVVEDMIKDVVCYSIVDYMQRFAIKCSRV